MRKTEVLKIGLIATLFFLVGTSRVWAGVCPMDDWIAKQAGSDVYYVKAGGMFLRGLHRIIESPIEIGYHTYSESKNNLKYGAGVLKGLGTGLLWTVDGELRGAWDIVTALFPDYHGEPGTHDLGAEIHGKK